MEIMARTAEEVRLHGGCEKIMDWIIEHEDYWIIGRALALMESLGYVPS